MKKTAPTKIYSLSRRIVLIATMAALLIVGKFSLALVPNIEVVTTLVIVFGFVFGFDTVMATLIFCAVDTVLYPTTPSVIVSYLIYWNLLALMSASFSRLGIKSQIPYLILGLVMTIFFGVLTSLADSILTGVSFVRIYAAGIIFFLLHYVSTLVFMAVGFAPLSKALLRLYRKLETIPYQAPNTNTASDIVIAQDIAPNPDIATTEKNK